MKRQYASCSARHESGEELTLLSGVAAILRYPLPMEDVDDESDEEEEEEGRKSALDFNDDFKEALNGERI